MDIEEIKRKFKFTSQEISQFEALGVTAVVLFGSQVLGLAGPASDFDFGVLLNTKGFQKRREDRGAMFESIHDIFSFHIKELKNIDVVFLQDAPGELQAHAVKNAQVLFETKPGIFADFKARIMLEYADFSPLRKIFHQGILSRIS